MSKLDNGYWVIKEQLQPKVQMTREQYNQFVNYETGKVSFYHFWQSLLADDISLVKDVSERDLMLAWINPSMIEIVHTKKWFVRSKDPNDEGYYAFLENLVRLKLNWCYSEDKQKPYRSAVKFDTKEQAEDWCNPLTKAVLLPVEDGE